VIIVPIRIGIGINTLLTIFHKQLKLKGLVFAIATVTKVFATIYAIMYLYEKGQIDVDALTTQYIPHFKFANTALLPFD
jgi:CubicO group peptidase (beta-lactamase class C family)